MKSTIIILLFTCCMHGQVMLAGDDHISPNNWNLISLLHTKHDITIPTHTDEYAKLLAT